jgi:hypothetical protein
MAENEMLSPKEAEMRAQEGADALEELINRISGEPGKSDEERHNDLVSHFMSLLAETYGIAPEPIASMKNSASREGEYSY